MQTTLEKITRKFLLASLLAIPCALAAQPEQIFEFDSYKDIMQLFDDLGYTESSWESGERGVYRAYLQNIPSRWRGKYSHEIEVKMKKEVFLRILAPLVLRSNELILKDRERMLSLVNSGSTNDPWLLDLARRYRLPEPSGHVLSEGSISELTARVDSIPNSLALAQTIEESGWGTSRFADLGNAMFGQWAWGETAIKPEQQRSGKGDYGIAAFDSPQDSVSGYMLNINTHGAYAPLREKRAEIRAAGGVPTGQDLAPTLVNYSERGQHYVESLNTIMSYNKLYEIDSAVLTGSTILLVPVGPGAD